MKARGFDEAAVHWHMGTSCHIPIHCGGESTDSAAIRADVPSGAAKPVASQAPFRSFAHGREMTEAVVDLSALGPVTLMPEVCDAMGEVLSEEGADREGSLSIDAVAKVNNDSRILRTYGAALVDQGRSEEACRYSRTEAQKSLPAG